MFCNSSDCLEKIFKSRLKKVSDGIMQFWAEEIEKMNLLPEILEDGTKYILDDDEMPLTLPKVKKAYREAKIRWLMKNDKLLDYSQIPRCPYCMNTGITLFAFKFDSNGNLLSQNTVLRCHCDKANNDLKHLRNEEKRKILFKGGYYKAYTSAQWAYVMPIISKTKKDVVIDWANDLRFKDFCKSLVKTQESIKELAKQTSETMPKID